MFNVVTIYHSTLCVSSKKRNIGIIEPSLVRNITLLGVLKILLQKMYIQYTYFVYINSTYKAAFFILFFRYAYLPNISTRGHYRFSKWKFHQNFGQRRCCRCLHQLELRFGLGFWTILFAQIQISYFGYIWLEFSARLLSRRKPENFGQSIWPKIYGSCGWSGLKIWSQKYCNCFGNWFRSLGTFNYVLWLYIA